MYCVQPLCLGRTATPFAMPRCLCSSITKSLHSIAPSRASVLETLLTAQTRLVLQTATYRRQKRKLQQRSKHPREMVTPKASTSLFVSHVQPRVWHALLPPSQCLVVNPPDHPYARRSGQPTQRATHYTARSNIDTAQIFLHANGQSAPRSGGARDVGRGAESLIPSPLSCIVSQCFVASCITSHSIPSPRLLAFTR